RGEGVARTLLGWLQRHVLSGPVLISCDAHNHASLKVIASVGGQLLDRRYHAGDRCWVNFYRIQPHPARQQGAADSQP
ncbi:TPA: GNAT family N-acetyltransferase, partial [Aeromonas dhakensis]|nr:GNAT family N-acetyltransferase [Aeromonas dhakensis]